MYLLHRSDDGWARLAIPPHGAALRHHGDGTQVELFAGRDAQAPAHVVPFFENERPHAALLVAPSARAVFLDGVTPLGLAVLGERSELMLGGVRLYFTAREPLVVSRCAASAEECALCGDACEGALVVRCSGCGAVTHEGALRDGRELLCFSHGGRCPRCQLTREDLDWTPED